jgi:N utilization substance protein A
MNPSELLRIVDAIHRDKNIDKEIVFEGIEAALVSAAKKHYGEEEEVEVHIDRQSGAITGSHNGVPLDPDEMSERIGAQTAKQVMIQKIREAERDALYDEYAEQKDQLVTGVVQRYEGGTATVALSNTEAILPRSEQIPGEAHHANERVRATVYEVRKQGSRVKIVLSRCRPHLVERLFEQEIPEITDGVIEVKAMAREPGYRTKVAVSSTDQRVDCVGACVGVRGNRIKNIVDELAGERIDIVRWSDDMQVLIPNALQPADVEEVILCQMLGRAIVLVREDQLSLAIGRRGQNVRLASKLCGWDIEIMTREELDQQLEEALMGFASLDGVGEELADRLVGEGFLSYDDLSVIEPDDLWEMGSQLREQAKNEIQSALEDEALEPDERERLEEELSQWEEFTMEEVNHIVEQAEFNAEEAERAAAEERRRQREQEQQPEPPVAMAQAGADAPQEAATDVPANPDQTVAGQNDQQAGARDGAEENEPVAEQTDEDEAIAERTDEDEAIAEQTDEDEAVAEQTDEDERVAEQAAGEQGVAEQEADDVEAIAEQASVQEAVAEQAAGEQGVAEQEADDVEAIAEQASVEEAVAERTVLDEQTDEQPAEEKRAD